MNYLHCNDLCPVPNSNQATRPTECIRVSKTSISKTNIVPDIDESSISGYTYIEVAQFDIEVSSISGYTDIEVDHFDIDESSISGYTNIEDKTFDIDDSSISKCFDIEVL